MPPELARAETKEGTRLLVSSVVSDDLLGLARVGDETCRGRRKPEVPPAETARRLGELLFDLTGLEAPVLSKPSRNHLVDVEAVIQ